MPINLHKYDQVCIAQIPLQIPYEGFSNSNNAKRDILNGRRKEKSSMKKILYRDTIMTSMLTIRVKYLMCLSHKGI